MSVEITMTESLKIVVIIVKTQMISEFVLMLTLLHNHIYSDTSSYKASL